ncbi:glycogen synthase GlgA [Candidatus Sumerlaeota bacterium]|nr:glycogen synthase GlgA [Candidatus Sumerlaeota bacterium]
MKILFVASEAVPFCKTGGLADVAGALPRILHERGHDVRLVLPRYGDIDNNRFRLLPLMPEMKVRYGERTFAGSIMRCSYPKSQMPVYFVDEPSLFGRKGIYGNGHGDFSDNDVRFAFFNMAALWLLKGLDWQPDVVHVNDWQTGLIPALLRHHPEILEDPFYREIKTVFMIHNLSYQGNFNRHLVPSIGLPWSVFTHDGAEFYEKFSFLKSGIVYSDKLVAVSPTYSREIQTEEYGAGMDGALTQRGRDLVGILNGIDVSEWNPESDTMIAHNFTPKDLAGKQNCREELVKLGNLDKDSTHPLIGITSRLVDAKGFDLVEQAIDDLLALDAQFFILGTGDAKHEQLLKETAAKHPGRMHVHIGYDVPLSHKVIAGSDLFLMPSRYEPCGLTQMYSMKYGTIPIVRKTGGLSDTVFPATQSSIDASQGTGFLFEEYDARAMVRACKEAIALFKSHPKSWHALMKNAMRQDFSWQRSAEKFEALYRSLGDQ